MRSNMITVAAVVAGIFLAAPMATADDVQEQLRLMEQRMAEMEDRLQATSEELNTAKTTVEEQQNLLTDAGLAGDDSGIRSGVGNFLKEVDVSGVVAASYNYRFLDSGDDNSPGGNAGYFRHPDANTFALDQVWLTIDKAVTDESRAGFHADYVHGKTAQSQALNSGINADEGGLLYTGYLSYLAPVGSGIQIDAGKLESPLGAESVQTNKNFNVTQGLLFGLQPVTFVGVQASTALSDNLGLTVGIVNDVYTANNFDNEYGKAYYSQLVLATDLMSMSVGSIVGNNSNLGCAEADDDCFTSVLDVVITAEPTENLSVWANFDWVRIFEGQNNRNAAVGVSNGDAFGVAGAFRLALSDATGFSARTEYIRTDSDFNSNGTTSQLGEIVSLTGTIDHALTDDLKLRLEARWDRILDNAGAPFFNGENGPMNINGTTVTGMSRRDDQVVGLAELYYEF